MVLPARTLAAVAFAALLALGGCAPTQRVAPPAPLQRPAAPEGVSAADLAPPQRGDGWDTASAREAGLAPEPLARLTEAIRRGEEYRDVHAVLIAKDGRLVYEAYVPGEDEHGRRGALGRVAFDADTRHDTRSITKSIVSALVGIAIGSGTIASVDQPLLSFFPEYAADAAPGWGGVTLRHALDMSAGIAWDETAAYTDSANTAVQMNRSPDLVRFVLSQPVADAPGSRWTYSGGLTQLLAEVVRRATGQPVDAYARAVLFQPLGITDVEWMPDAGRETPDADSGLRLRPRDLAKVGLLYQQQGRWDGRQIVPEAWVAASLRPHIALPDSTVEFGAGATGVLGYGSQWWHAEYTLPAGRFTAHWAQGNGGQLLFLVPDLQLVAVVTAGRYDGENDSRRLVLERIVPWALGAGDTPYRFYQERAVRWVAEGEWPEVALTAAERSRYLGTFAHDGDRLRVWEDGGVLHMTPYGWAQGAPVHLVPMGNHVFGYGLYDAGRLTRVYWPDDRIEFVMGNDRALRFLDRAADGHVYTTAERIP